MLSIGRWRLVAPSNASCAAPPRAAPRVSAAGRRTWRTEARLCERTRAGGWGADVSEDAREGGVDGDTVLVARFGGDVSDDEVALRRDVTPLVALHPHARRQRARREAVLHRAELPCDRRHRLLAHPVQSRSDLPAPAPGDEKGWRGAGIRGRRGLGLGHATSTVDTPSDVKSVISSPGIKMRPSISTTALSPILLPAGAALRGPLALDCARALARAFKLTP
jgi:hypothetical protein